MLHQSFQEDHPPADSSDSDFDKKDLEDIKQLIGNNGLGSSSDEDCAKTGKSRSSSDSPKREHDHANASITEKVSFSHHIHLGEN